MHTQSHWLALGSPALGAGHGLQQAAVEWNNLWLWMLAGMPGGRVRLNPTRSTPPTPAPSHTL